MRAATDGHSRLSTKGRKEKMFKVISQLLEGRNESAKSPPVMLRPALTFSGQAMLTAGFCVGVAILLASSATGCATTAPQTSTTTLTSASIDPGIPSSREAEETAAAIREGELVCRAKTQFEGTVELYLDWKNGSAKGIVRRVAPSGEVHITKVHAEKYKEAIIADDPASNDLVVHAATVQTHNGKNHIRLGDWKQAWAPCQ
jgi:hypothetical protein